MSPSRRYTVLALAALLTVLPSLRAETIVDAPGRFSIDFPQTPRRESSEVNSGFGKGTMHLLLLDAPDSTAYILGYNDYPAGSIAKVDREKTYADIVKGVVDSLKGVVRSNVEHKLGAVVGREYVLVNEKDKFLARVRCYFVGDRLYQVMYMGPIGSDASKQATDFLGSFKLR